MQPTPGAKMGKEAPDDGSVPAEGKGTQGSGAGMQSESESKEWYIIIPVLATSGVLILFCVGQCLCKRAVAKRRQSIEAPHAATESTDVAVAEGPTATKVTGTTEIVVR